MQSPASPATIAFIGLGQMGIPMARQLLSVGYAINGCDLSGAARSEVEAAGGRAFATPGAAARGADMVIAMLPNGHIVREALLRDDGAVGSLRDGAIVIDMSSSAPTDTVALGKELRSRGVVLVDAPVSGGRKRAVDGTLTIMVGGEEAAVNVVQPVLDAMGGRIFRTGKLGTGHAMKALNNYVSGAGAVAAMEALILGRAFGLEPDTMVDILNVSTGRNNTTEVKLKEFVLNSSWGSGFALGLMTKDIGIADALAGDLNLRMDALTRIAAIWKEAEGALESGADHTEIFRYLERRSEEG